MSTKSPAFISVRTLSHSPSVMNVRLLRPARAQLTTLTFVGSKNSTRGSAQPRAPFALLLAVESPITNSVGNCRLVRGIAADAEGDVVWAGTRRANPAVTSRRMTARPSLFVTEFFENAFNKQRVLPLLAYRRDAPPWAPLFCEPLTRLANGGGAHGGTPLQHRITVNL